MKKMTILKIESTVDIHRKNTYIYIYIAIYIGRYASMPLYIWLERSIFLVMYLIIESNLNDLLHS